MDEDTSSSTVKIMETTAKSLDEDDEKCKEGSHSSSEKLPVPTLGDDNIRVFLMLYGETDNHSIEISRKDACLSVYIKESIDGKMSREITHARDPKDPTKFLRNEQGDKVIECVTTEIKYAFNDGTTGPECKTKTPLYSFVEIRMPEAITRPQLERIASYLVHHSGYYPSDTTTRLKSNDLSKCIDDPFDLKWIQEVSESLGQKGFYEFATSILSIIVPPIQTLFAKQIACWIYGCPIHVQAELFDISKKKTTA